MERKNLIGLAVIILILLGIGAYALTRPASPSPASQGRSIPAAPLAYEEHEAYYDIVAHYPGATPLADSVSASADAAAVAAMKKFVTDSAAQFKVDGRFASLTPEDIRMMGFDQGRKLSFTIDYLIASSPRTVSYIYIVNEDTGGAHGNTYFRTFTYDSQTGEALALSDLFVPGAEYLGKLSQIAREKFPATLGDIVNERMLEEGTAPVKENFENFFLDKDTLALMFPPYQIAAYAAGPQTLSIPRAELSSLLKPEYQ